MIKPNEQLTVEAGGLRTFALRLLRLAGNSPRKRLLVQPTSYGSVILVARRILELEAYKATAHDNFRRAQIR